MAAVKTASDWAASIALSMVNGEAAINIGEIARVIALAMAEARREALKEALSASDGERCDQHAIENSDHCCGHCCGCRRESSDAIRALAAKAQP